MPIPIWIGYDRRETVAFHVLAHSLIQNSKLPLALTAIGNATLPTSCWWRPRGPFDSTEFSTARFLVPYLMDYHGWALFADGDMLAGADIGELWEQRDERFAVMLRKHDYRPTRKTKFLGETQTVYPRKNWSSLMLLNCCHPSTQNLTCEYVNNSPGLDLHGFAWCLDEEIGEIKGSWNTLIKHEDDIRLELIAEPPQLAHFTEGGPWHGYTDQPFAKAWTRALISMLTSNNPSAKPIPGLAEGVGKDLRIGVTYTLAR